MASALSVPVVLALAVTVTAAPDRRAGPASGRPAEQVTNLLHNSSFEVGSLGWGTPGAQRLHGRLDAGAAVHGQHSLRIDLIEALLPQTTVAGIHVANLGWVEVTPGLPHAFSAFAKSSRPTMGMELAARERDGTAHRRSVSVTDRWGRHVLSFTPQGRYVFVVVGVPLDAQPEVFGGRCWVDALQLECGATAGEYETRQPVEGALSTPRAGNLFIDESPEVVARFFNAANHDLKPSYTVTVTDWEDRLVAQAGGDVPLPAGQARERRLHDLLASPSSRPLRGPSLPTGFYRAELTVMHDESVTERGLRFAVLPEPSAGDDPPFGLDVAYPSDTTMRVMRRLGVTCVGDSSSRAPGPAGAPLPAARALSVRPGQEPPEAALADLRAPADQPVWLTVDGYRADDDPAPRGEAQGASWSERIAAEYLARLNLLAFARGVDKVVFRDRLPEMHPTGSDETIFFEFGGAPRPALCALAVQAQLLGEGIEPHAELDLGSARACVFGRAEGALAAVWLVRDAPKQRSVGPPAGGDIALRDMMGRELTAERLMLSTAPVYVTSSALSAARLADWVAALGTPE